MSMDMSRRSYSHEEVLSELLRDPEFRTEWERTTIPRVLCLFLLNDRIERKLSQTAYARLLGLSQPAYARLEIGEHVPTVATLKKLSNALGVSFRIDIRPDSVDATGKSIEIIELWPLSEIRGAVEDDQLRSAAD